MRSITSSIPLPSKSQKKSCVSVGSSPNNNKSARERRSKISIDISELKSPIAPNGKPVIEKSSTVNPSASTKSSDVSTKRNPDTSTPSS